MLDSLEKSDPLSCVELTYLYRMNEEIMRLSNKLIYSDKLRCGNNQIQANTISQHCDETVSATSLVLPQAKFLSHIKWFPILLSIYQDGIVLSAYIQVFHHVAFRMPNSCLHQVANDLIVVATI